MGTLFFFLKSISYHGFNFNLIVFDFFITTKSNTKSIRGFATMEKYFIKNETICIDW